MLLLICSLMIAAVILEIFCFSQLSTTEKPRSKPVQATPKEKAKEKTTSLGRPIRIIQING